MVKTVKGRIIFGIAVVTLGVLIITNFTLWRVFKGDLKKYIISDMDKIKSIAYGEVQQIYINGFKEEKQIVKDGLVPILSKINRLYDSYISIDNDENNNIAFMGRLLNEVDKKNILRDSGKKSSVLYTALDERGFYATYTYPVFILDDYKGTIVLQKNYNDEYINYKKIMTQIVAVESILYIVMLLVFYIWLTKITKSLKDLRTGMELIEKGHYTSELKVNGNDEIANLAEHFNRMQSKIIKQMDQLYIENKRIEELDRERKDFFNYATHEMKTPITAIRGYGELLEQGEVEENIQKKIYSRIILEADRIHNLVQNMLVIARGREKVEQAEEYFNIRTLISDMAKEFELTLEKEEIKIDINILDAEICAVREEIRVVFKNLIDNGIKYSRDKKICIENRDYNPLIINVKNKCHPVPVNVKEHLLDPFIKYNYGDLEKVSSGLGLFICRELLSKNNGKIIYEIDKENICFIIEFF